MNHTLNALDPDQITDLASAYVVLLDSSVNKTFELEKRILPLNKGDI
jgi:hypothetical protein